MCFSSLNMYQGNPFPWMIGRFLVFQINVKMFETSAGYQPLSGFRKNQTLVSSRSLSNELPLQNQVKTALQKKNIFIFLSHTLSSRRLKKLSHFL